MWRSLISVLLPVLGISAAPERSETLEAVAPLAAALSSGDAGEFLRRIPQNAPNYVELRENVRALVEQNLVTSSVDMIGGSGDAADLDWYMEIRNRTTDMIVEVRRGRVRVTIKNGKVTAITPASHFAPPKPTAK